MPAADAPAEERAAWDEAMTAHRQRFERMDLVRQQMLGLDWAYGQVCPEGIYSRGCILADVGADSRGAIVLGELAMSLMAAGRFVEAQATMESAATIGAPRAVAEAARVQSLLLGEVPDLAPHLPTEVLSEPLETAAAGACEEATAAVQGALSGGGDPEAESRLVAAYVVVLCSPEDPEVMARVAEALEPLTTDRAYADRFPALSYLLARAAMVSGDYSDATWTMLRHVRQVGLERPAVVRED
jgi:hypothetical protein